MHLSHGASAAACSSPDNPPAEKEGPYTPYTVQQKKKTSSDHSRRKHSRQGASAAVVGYLSRSPCRLFSCPGHSAEL